MSVLTLTPMIMNRFTLLLAVLLLSGNSRLSAFPGETRSYFKDWLVVCQNNAYLSERVGHCRTSTGIRNHRLFPYADGTLFQLTLQRELDTDYHLEFYHVLEQNFPSGTVTFQIDNNPPRTLAVDLEGNLARISRSWTLALTPQIMAGRWLKLHYISRSGIETELKVSLLGVTASMEFIERFYNNRRE